MFDWPLEHSVRGFISMGYEQRIMLSTLTLPLSFTTLFFDPPVLYMYVQNNKRGEWLTSPPPLPSPPLPCPRDLEKDRKKKEKAGVGKRGLQGGFFLIR